jgi:hypothetical protein
LLAVKSLPFLELFPKWNVYVGFELKTFVEPLLAKTLLLAFTVKPVKSSNSKKQGDIISIRDRKK